MQYGKCCVVFMLARFQWIGSRISRHHGWVYFVELARSCCLLKEFRSEQGRDSRLLSEAVLDDKIFAFERRPWGASGAADRRSARQQRFVRTRPSEVVRRLEQRLPTLQPWSRQRPWSCILKATSDDFDFEHLIVDSTRVRAVSTLRALEKWV